MGGLTLLAFVEDRRAGVVDADLLGIGVELPAALVDALLSHDWSYFSCKEKELTLGLAAWTCR